MHVCFICIGSNFNRKENIRLARQRLTELFPSIRFAKEMETKPLFFSNPDFFINQVASFLTENEEDKVTGRLKAIELEVGRRPEDKAAEIVRLDIDLLMYDDKVIKPKDLKRDYIQKGLDELNT